MAKAKKEIETGAETPRRGLFGVYDDVRDLVTNEIGRFKLELGSNRVRVITPPIAVPKHWDVPETADGKVMPCLQFFGDKMAEMGDPAKRKAIIEALPECPWCALEAEYGNAKLGKDKGFYNRQYTHVVGVVADGKALIWEISQKSIMDKLMRFEADPDWAEFMPNGLQDLELIVKKIDKSGKTEYEVGGAPKAVQLSDEELAEYISQLPDILALVRPPDHTTEEGEALIAELTRKNGAPVKGDRPKKLGK